MNGDARRTHILARLEKATAPVSASALAEACGVSRQVIVQDIALLRAQGMEISSHARGYVLVKSRAVSRVFKVLHTDEDVERELNLIVDLGGTVEDVFVYHKVYGEVHAPMGIHTRLQVRRFLKDIAEGKSSLLKNVTAGYHYHTIVADSKETLALIEQALREGGFLAPLQAYEPTQLSGGVM
ncbi:MAG: transcription repressor NadR [Clostridia bacterium]|nr:transcription repressor NadR [Clostridia bacterium]